MGGGKLTMGAALMGTAAAAVVMLFKAVSLKRKQVQLSRVLEASQNSCSIQAARVPDLQQQANQLTAQLEAVQEANSTCTQQRVQLQQQLGETQEQLCSTQQQVVQLQDSMEVLQAQVASSDERIDELEYERVYVDYDLEEAQEALEKAATSHQLEVAQLEGKQSRLLAGCLHFEKEHENMACEKKQEEALTKVAEQETEKAAAQLRTLEKLNRELQKQLDSIKAVKCNMNRVVVVPSDGSSVTSQSSSDCGDDSTSEAPTCTESMNGSFIGPVVHVSCDCHSS